MPPTFDNGSPRIRFHQYEQQKQSAAVSARTVKCVLVGDGAVGKTSIIVSYTTNGYPHEYVPTAFDNYSVMVQVDNQPVRLQLCDTAGQSDLTSLRPLCYPDTDVFLACFSVVNPESFYRLEDHWVPELRQHAPDTPILLVGTQADLRRDAQAVLALERLGETPIAEKEAAEYATEIDAISYIECSALTQRNLKEVFDAVILASISNETREFVKRHKSGEEAKRAQKREPSGSDSGGGISFKKLKQKLKGTAGGAAVMPPPATTQASCSTTHNDCRPPVPMTRGREKANTIPQMTKSKVMLKRLSSNGRINACRTPAGGTPMLTCTQYTDEQQRNNASGGSKLKDGWRRLVNFAKNL